MRFKKKLFSNLEPEGQGRGTIMGVTRLLLLELFYTIQSVAKFANRRLQLIIQLHKGIHPIFESKEATELRTTTK